MRLVSLVESPEHVCCRYRLQAYCPALESAGHELAILPLPERWFQRIRLFRSLQGYDAVIVQRKLFASPILRSLRYYARQLIFDFDDAVWMRDSYHPKGLKSRVRETRFAAMVRNADAIVAGNHFLGQHALLHTRNPVTVIPTSVEPKAYPLAPHASRDTFTLAWIGSASTLKSLKPLIEIFPRVREQVPNLRLKLICDQFLEFPGVPVDTVPWSENTEAKELADADAGIAWMPDDDWSRGKCGLKVIQYQAAGLPVIANPVGVHRLMVNNGVNGYLVQQAEDWIRVVKDLATHANLRLRLGQHGRKQVETHYAVAEGSKRWVSLVNRLAEMNAPKPALQRSA